MRGQYSKTRKALTSLLYVLIYSVSIVALLVGLHFVLHALSINLHANGTEEGASSIASSLVTLLLVLIATFIIGVMRSASILDFGLRDRAWLTRAMIGVASGVVSIGILIALLMWAARMSLTPSNQSAVTSIGYGILWAIGYLGIASLEENMFRGVPLAELSRAFGFPVAAVITSAFFAALHLGNSDESVLAAANAFVLAIILCISIKLTGSLWWAIGFHASWDWVESYFVGAADSGIVARGRLMNSVFAGPEWLSGGAAGPEGSVFMLVATAVAGLCLATHLKLMPANAALSGVSRDAS